MKKTLLFLLLITFTSAACAVDSSTAEKKYPPYPEVWHRVMPKPRVAHGLLEFLKTPNNDYLVMYQKNKIASENGASFEDGAIYFFSGRMLHKINIKDYRSDHKFIRDRLEIRLSDGITIKLDSLDQRGNKRCPQSLYHYFAINYPDSNIAEKKSLLYVLDKPHKRQVNRLCVDTLEKSFKEKIVSIQGLFVPLADGGFLLSDRHVGLIVRFDSQLNTKSDLINKKLFWIDTNIISQFRKEGDVNYQAMQDYLYDYVRKEMKR